MPEYVRLADIAGSKRHMGESGGLDTPVKIKVSLTV